MIWMVFDVLTSLPKGNMWADKTIRLATSHDRFVWAANAATTEAAFKDTITKLAQASTCAAEYLRSIPAERWALHPNIKTTSLYGWRTTKFVESEQARSLKLRPRLMLPLEFLKAYGTSFMGEMYNWSKQLQTWLGKGRHVAFRSEMKLQSQLKAAEEYSAVFSSDGIAYVARVTHHLKQRQVNTETPECSCMTWMQLMVHVAILSQHWRFKEKTQWFKT